MAIQHAGGTIVNNTWVGATRTAVVDGIKGDLVTAGWSVASGSSGDWKLDSAVSAQGLQLRVRLYDPGSGNCARVRIMNVTESVAPALDVYLLPAAAKTFRVVACQYQAFVFSPGSVSARDFGAFGLPYLPAHLASPSSGYIYEAGWLAGNAQSDTDTAFRASLRTKAYNNSSAQACFVNGSYWSQSNPNGVGEIRLCITGDPRNGNDNLVRWHTDEYLITDAIIGWGLAGSNDECKARGQLWEAFVDTADRAADTTFPFDDGGGSHDYIAITNNNTGAGRGTLCVAIT